MLVAYSTTNNVCHYMDEYYNKKTEEVQYKEKKQIQKQDLGQSNTTLISNM